MKIMTKATPGRRGSAEETLKWKVEFANSQGLRGLFIWAVTQDTAKHDLLDAFLQPDGLGKFKKRNGVRSAVDDWDTKTFDNCEFSVSKCNHKNHLVSKSAVASAV